MIDLIWNKIASCFNDGRLFTSLEESNVQRSALLIRIQDNFQRQGVVIVN